MQLWSAEKNFSYVNLGAASLVWMVRDILLSGVCCWDSEEGHCTGAPVWVESIFSCGQLAGQLGRIQVGHCSPWVSISKTKTLKSTLIVLSGLLQSFSHDVEFKSYFSSTTTSRPLRIGRVAQLSRIQAGRCPRSPPQPRNPILFDLLTLTPHLLTSKLKVFNPPTCFLLTSNISDRQT